MSHCDPLTFLPSLGKIVTLPNFSLSTIVSSGYDFSIVKLLSEFKEIRFNYSFIKKPKHFGTYIVTSGPPVSAKVHRLAPDKLQSAKREFQYMLEPRICRPSNSSCATPLHFVWKKTGNWRLCGNYQTLNTVTQPDRYSIPHQYDLTHDLHGCTIFSTLDLKRSYHQLLVEPSDQKYRHCIHFGQYE
ncbi:retrotransposable element Tf2 155 kDa protein type 1 [Trichonephila clavipes]|nr:retrotransposable element Tf2 155 kDa protein type 1 [Trichonephila clavipes]